MDSVGSVALEIKVLRKELINEAKAAAKEAAKEAQAEANKASKGFSKSLGGASSALGGLGSVASKVGGILGAVFSVAKIVSFSKACIDLGSDLAEVQNVVDVVYGNMSADVNSFAQSAIKSYGMSETVAKNYMGTLGAMSKAFGFTTQEAYGQAEALTALAGDMASFYNKSTDETFTALKAVYSGETEVLKQYGVVMNETALNEFALSQGISKTVKEMSEQEKVSLRLAFVQDRLSAASGDFQRTSGGWANQVRVLSLQFDSFKASIGQGFINVLTPVVQWLNMIMESANKAAQAFSNFTASIMGVTTDATGGMGGIAAETASAAEGADDLASGIESAGGAAKKAMQQLAGFDRINTLSSDSSIGGSGGGSTKALSNTLATAAATGEVVSETRKWKEALDGVIQKAKQVKDAFVEGFNESYGGSKYIDGIKKDIGSIGSTAKSIFTDPEVQGAADSCTESWARAFGSISGTVATVTVGATKTVTGTIDKFLTENEDPIKDHLVTMFDLSSREGDAVASLSGSVSRILQSVFDSGNLETAGANIAGVFFDITSAVNEFRQAVESGFLEGFAEGIKSFEKDVSEALVNITDAIAKFTGAFKRRFDIVRKNFESSGIAEKAREIGKAIGETIGTIAQGFNKIYPIIEPVIRVVGDFLAKYGAAFFAGLVTAFNTILSVLKSIFTAGKGVVEVITGIFTGDWDMITKGFEDIIGSITGLFRDLAGDLEGFFANIIQIFDWDKLIKPITDAARTIGGIFNSLWCVIVGIFSPAYEWFNTTFIQPWTERFESAKATVFNSISGLWSGIQKVWQGASKWWTDHVTGPISSAFEGVRTTVKGAFNSALGTIESAINNILSGLNRFIDKLDGFGQKGAELLGQTYNPLPKFSSISIPRLAQGGFVEANTPQLALIGDNKREGEIVAPESKIAQAVAAAMMQVLPYLRGANNNVAVAGTGDTRRNITLELDGQVIYEVVQDYDRKNNSRSGGRA